MKNRACSYIIHNYVTKYSKKHLKNSGEGNYFIKSKMEVKNSDYFLNTIFIKYIFFLKNNLLEES